MRLVGLTIAAAILGGGCRIGYKSTAGGATAPEGFSKGVTRSLQFSDEGGLLSRAGLGVLGVAVAAGSIENVSSTSNTWTSGNTRITETTTTGTINTGTAQAAADIANAAGDSGTKLSSPRGGLAANLEIAGTTLGGDTHGWQYDMGWAFRRFSRAGSTAWGLRGYIGLGYGSFSMTDRMMDRVDRGPPKFGDAELKFFGMPSRFGLFFLTGFDKPSTIMGTETFVKLNGNLLGPSVVHLGQRLQFSLVYLEAEVSTSGTTSDDVSYGLELGIGI
jgi:hypothetical protein